MTANHKKSSRRPYTQQERVVLLTEVKSLCPLCGEKLIINKNGNTIYAYEIAHIYPHSPTEYQLELLNNEERLSDDPDSIENLILLCPTCHSRYDKKTEVEEYRELVKIKKKLLAENECKNLYADYSIDEDINRIIDNLAITCKSQNSFNKELELNAMRVSEKSDETLHVLTRVTIEQYVRVFYYPIKEKFIELEKEEEGIFDLIASQIKSFYLDLKRTEKNKTVLFDHVTDWIMQRSSIDNRHACQIIASYFVQNCEVLS